MQHRLTFQGGAQTIRTVALRDGNPVALTSATYAVVDLRRDADDADHVVEQGNATIDSVSTTLAAAAGRSTTNPRQVTVASAVGIAAGRRYLLQSGGRVELVQVTGVSGTTLDLAAPLSRSFVVGSAFLGVEASATITADACADEEFVDEPNRLAVRWSMTPTTGAVLQPFLEQLYLERLGPAPLTTPDELLKLDSTLHAYVDDGFTLADALAQAQADYDCDMLAAGVDDDEILAGPIGKRLILYAGAWHLLKSSTEPSAVARAERYHARRQELLASLLQGWDKAKTARLTKEASAREPDVRSRFASRW